MAQRDVYMRIIMGKCAALKKIRDSLVIASVVCVPLSFAMALAMGLLPSETNVALYLWLGVACFATGLIGAVTTVASGVVHITWINSMTSKE